MSIIKKAIPVIIVAASAPAFAAGETSALDQMFAAVNLGTVVTFVASAGVTIVGIALATKGISLAKRLVSKA
ncbi:hypothetical protein J4G63_21335 [Aeromonas sobria]|jgi:hypothetical protein|uniref:Phage coat protein n=1 Tax=Aeromonas sobria TaxID=646 RepID=A0A1S2CV15_AERSO|nr:MULTISPECIES: hypothetical protein [Aeromonas]AMQ42611.1 hypothetical protein AMS64_09605 [Aeromonas veronii]MBS4689764.1 hypothetical protein [Aeromonas sobria]MCF7719369.1 phage coat protein [Aeromonas jandaei]MCS0539091.1 hypothetical protein [Aeromonas veronii]MCX0424790.1 hypothetical protein [Aeromonas veronii]